MGRDPERTPSTEAPQMSATLGMDQAEAGSPELNGLQELLGKRLRPGATSRDGPCLPRWDTSVCTVTQMTTL